ncbi:MAG TPA: hypothetical protein DIU15_03435 [Deltaproteobacteria bacterium]|nr:hypothetical protein [Deltaproteobacteria bacterium]
MIRIVGLIVVVIIATVIIPDVVFISRAADADSRRCLTEPLSAASGGAGLRTEPVDTHQGARAHRRGSASGPLGKRAHVAHSTPTQRIPGDRSIAWPLAEVGERDLSYLPRHELEGVPWSQLNPVSG